MAAGTGKGLSWAGVRHLDGGTAQDLPLGVALRPR